MDTEKLIEKEERGKSRKKLKRDKWPNHSLNYQFSNSGQEAISQSFIFDPALAWHNVY